MRLGTKLGAFALVLAAAFGVGAAVGAAVGPIDVGGGQHGPPPVESTVPADHEGH